jgi:hypothetical protein
MNFQVSEEFANKSYHVTMPDGRVWAVPLLTIALNRAQYYTTLSRCLRILTKLQIGHKTTWIGMT